MLEQITTLLTSLVLALLIVAVASDVRSHRIPNWVVAGVLALGALIQCAGQGLVGLTSAVPGSLVALFFFLPFYVRRAMGAGDVKLMAAAGAWLGPAGAVLACAVALVAGLLMAVLALVARTAVSRRPMLGVAGSVIPQRLRAALCVERDGQLKVPYAAAIATGALTSAWYLDKLTFVAGLAH